MLLLKTIVVSFILPPGLIVLGLAALGGVAMKRRRAWTGVALLAAAAILWLASIAPAADLAVAGLEADYYSIEAEVSGDVIVVLGGGHQGGAPDLTGTGTPSRDAVGRLVTAARLQRRLGLPVIASGGQVFDHHVAEASIAQRFLADLGVPPDKILIEDQSEDTQQNATFTKRLCDQHGLRQPILVTSAFHMRRALFAFEQAGLKATPVAAGFFTWIGKEYGLQDFCPSASSLHVLSIALRERIGLVYYRLYI